MYDNQTYVDSNPVSDFVLGELRSGKTELIFEDKKIKHLFDLELKHWNALSSNRSKSPTRSQGSDRGGNLRAFSPPKQSEVNMNQTQSQRSKQAQRPQIRQSQTN